ncbi:pentapeptide repeat-containing protein [Paenibacillus daejeonensis]|uniref:pentapeptide repeat-containing protein n=1 Tax=Paenibacillus daejeonensis TaxID=135193 RepID=UPI00036558B1|nr:pentapeptide repeat-containing protein [Paenibacillus daejeonensis]
MTKHDKPRLPDQLAVYTAAELVERLNEDGYVDKGSISHERLEARLQGKMTIDSFHFRHVDATAYRVDESEWVDVIFEHCDLSNLDLSNAIMHRVLFRDCKLMGLELSEATLRQVSFENCDMRYMNMRYADLKRVSFDQCAMMNADAYQASFQEVSITRSNVDQIQLTGVKLAGLDLSSCEFDAIDAEPGDLRGCKISPAQAIAFAPLLGLIVDA